VADRAGPSPIRGEAQPRRSMHQVDMDLEWPMIDIPQELREMRGEDESNSRSNAQANAIKVKKKKKKKKKRGD
jgi:hypothetical protein